MEKLGRNVPQRTLNKANIKNSRIVSSKCRDRGGGGVVGGGGGGGGFSLTSTFKIVNKQIILFNHIYHLQKQLTLHISLSFHSFSDVCFTKIKFYR